MIHGRNLIVALDGVPVAGAKSCQFQISQNFIKACSPTEGRTKRKVPTDYDWSMSVDCLIPSSTLSVSLVDKLIAGTRVLLTFTDGSGQNRAGFAYVKSCDESGSIGSLAKFSASFEADGSLYKYTGYTPDAFKEGDKVQIRVINENVIYIFNTQQRGDELFGVEIHPSKNGTLYMFGDYLLQGWVLYNDQFSTIKTKLYNNQDPDSTITACGAVANTISLTSSQYYTFICNISTANLTPYRLLFLYE